MRSTSRWIRPCTVTTRSRSCNRGDIQGHIGHAHEQSSLTGSGATTKGDQRLKDVGESMDPTMSRAQSPPLGPEPKAQVLGGQREIAALLQNGAGSSVVDQNRDCIPQSHTLTGLDYLGAAHGLLTISH
jgi:hypothetical protein